MVKLIIAITIALAIKDWIVDPLVMSFFITRKDIEKDERSFKERLNDKMNE